MIDREYHVQDSSNVAHKYVKNYCDTNQFPALPFCGPHPKPHGARGLSKHDHLRCDPKLVHGICAIHRIPYAYVGRTSMLEKLWISGIPSHKQARYQPVTNCTYWPVLAPKSTPFESFDEIHKAVIEGISKNTASLSQSGMYGDIDTDDNTTNRFYVIPLSSETYTLQNITTIDGQIISAGELVVKA